MTLTFYLKAKWQIQLWNGVHARVYAWICDQICTHNQKCMGETLSSMQFWFFHSKFTASGMYDIGSLLAVAVTLCKCKYCNLLHKCCRYHYLLSLRLCYVTCESKKIYTKQIEIGKFCFWGSQTCIAFHWDWVWQLRLTACHCLCHTVGCALLRCLAFTKCKVCANGFTQVHNYFLKLKLSIVISQMQRRRKMGWG